MQGAMNKISASLTQNGQLRNPSYFHPTKASNPSFTWQNWSSWTCLGTTWRNCRGTLGTSRRSDGSGSSSIWWSLRTAFTTWMLWSKSVWRLIERKNSPSLRPSSSKRLNRGCSGGSTRERPWSTTTTALSRNIYIKDLLGGKCVPPQTVGWKWLPHSFIASFTDLHV